MDTHLWIFSFFWKISHDGLGLFQYFGSRLRVRGTFYKTFLSLIDWLILKKWVNFSSVFRTCESGVSNYLAVLVCQVTQVTVRKPKQNIGKFWDLCLFLGSCALNSFFCFGKFQEKTKFGQKKIFWVESYNLSICMRKTYSHGLIKSQYVIHV